MAKDKTASKSLMLLLASHGLDPADYEIVQDLAYSVIVRNKASGEHKIISKIG